MNNDLRFSTSNLIPILTSSLWTLNSATVTDGKLIIQPGGSASVDASSNFLNLCFQYAKVSVKFQSENIKPSNNFASKPKIVLECTYKDSENTISQNRKQCLGLNTYELIDSTEYIYQNDKIFKMLNKNIAVYTLRIENNSENTLTILNIGVFMSIDISEEQVGQVFNKVQSASEPSGFKIYTDSTYSILGGLSVLLKNSEKEIKYKPLFSNGLLAKIETNFGIEYPAVYVTEDIDLST